MREPWKKGHYIYVDTSFAKQGEKAVLLSSDLQAEEWSCLRLVYQITTSSGSPSDPSQLNLYVRFEDESFDRLLWSAKEPSDSWLIASLDLQNSPKKFKILIEGVLGQGNTASIALFEIKMTTGYCIECDFEENHLCGFVNRWNPNVNWFIGGGNTRNSHSILPQDHTLKSELGPSVSCWPLHVCSQVAGTSLGAPQTSIVSDQVPSRTMTTLTSRPKMPLMEAAPGTAPMSGCLSFYYQLQQGNDNIFSVYTRDLAGLYEEIWKSHSGNPAWNLAEVEFSAPYPMERQTSRASPRFWRVQVPDPRRNIVIWLKGTLRTISPKCFYSKVKKLRLEEKGGLLELINGQLGSNLIVIFEVAFNGPKGGYVALDDISFSPVHCQNQTVPEEKRVRQKLKRSSEGYCLASCAGCSQPYAFIEQLRATF
ncbi:PREDICTED: MAM domain-containing protein 2-like [Galeopterus variegatus]|uniref:MAM domain-containing protein 2-like n=1 Tax=Galeopterus variegatus TaxID=482537 RepID=A0ABM0QIT3_GALVR|nr:PREDICTED: MAM domain-containing protein 2-like [Galeopterus variegatus]